MSATPKTVRIKSITQTNPRMTTIVLDDQISMDPGQFIMLWIPGVDEKPFSVAAPSPLTIAVACIGPFTNQLKELKAGDFLGWRGPYGKGFTITGQKILVVGGGCGVASVNFLAQTCAQQGIQTHVVTAFKTAEEAFLIDELQKAGCTLHPCTDDGSLGFQGYAHQQVQELIKANQYDMIYACGPEVMLVALREVLEEASLPYQFSLERYMKCGIGICDQCSINGQLVCQDGPVFDQDQIRQLTELGKFKRAATGEKVAIGGLSC